MTTDSGPRSATIAQLPDLKGTTFDPGPWILVTQDMIDDFADATHDHQWIHVDQDRAALGPFGTTIAHGYLTLSLLPRLVYGIIEISDARMTLNYGVNRVRFPSPVLEGARLRGHMTVVDVDVRDDGSVLITRDVVAEIEGSDRPACVAQMLSLSFPARAQSRGSDNANGTASNPHGLA